MIKEIFSEPFMQRALLMALLMGPFCAMMGVFVTARKLSFFSETLAHSSLTGIALGFWWGLSDPTLVQILFSIVIAFCVVWLKENTKLLTDTIMAVLLSGAVALGVVILSLLKGYKGELHRYLFGDILATGPTQVWAGVVIAMIGSSFLLWKLRSLTLLTLNESLAKVSGVSAKALNCFFLLLLTLAVAFSVRLLGIILVTSLLVVPASAARNVSFSLRQHFLLSAFVGILSGGLGVVGSYFFDLPCGPVIVLVAIAFFILSVVVGFFQKIYIQKHQPSKELTKNLS